MDYITLNTQQKQKMNSIINHDYSMKWENPQFMDYLIGKLPDVNYNKPNDDVEKLRQLLLSYDALNSDKKCFLESTQKLILNLKKSTKSLYWDYLFEDISSKVKLHKCCLISGEGGIGKSFFIYSFQKKLEESGTPHLCLYGKFEKNTNNIDVNEIKTVGNSGFVFIVDAINEMSDEGQRNLLEIITQLKKIPKIRIVLSYRTNSMKKHILQEYEKISEYTHIFSGVSYESALNELITRGIPNVYKYEGILFSNNALLLKMLHSILRSKKITNENINGITTITFMLEFFIKESVNKQFKGCGQEIWQDTKKIAKWMYAQGQKYIDDSSLLSVVTSTKYLTIMKQMGFITEIKIEQLCYVFSFEILIDYLIVRSLFDDLKDKKTHTEKVDTIKQKLESFYNLKEPFIVAIFDKMAPDYPEIINILNDTNLINHLTASALVKVHYKNDEIQHFITIFKDLVKGNKLLEMGGFHNKPFNCKNFLFEYFCSNRKNTHELTEILSEENQLDSVVLRLKNILYFITITNDFIRDDDEPFYFALLCCSSPKKDVRYLALKLLYELLLKENAYINEVIEKYNHIYDFYIKEAIIYVLSQLETNNQIKNFYYKILKNDSLSSKSIYRICKYLDNPLSFIEWNRPNLYKYKKDAKTTQYFRNFLIRMEIHHKNFLPFNYWGYDDMDMHSTFLITPKQVIKKINDNLYTKYSHISGSDTCGSSLFNNKILSEIKTKYVIQRIDKKSLLENIERIFRIVLKYFYVIGKNNKTLPDIKIISDSLSVKYIDIAVGLYYGSLMCNYYIDYFSSFNNKHNTIGYDVYDPLEYGEEVIVSSPIPIYQELVEKLGNKIISSLINPSIHDVNWVKDIELTRKNVFSLMKPIQFKDHEWVMIAGRISLHGGIGSHKDWEDIYELWCCSSDKETITNDGNARLLTIELDHYDRAPHLYCHNDKKPWLCKRIENISRNYDIFDETSLVFPPSAIINHLQLQYNTKDASWENLNKEKIIICNNNKNSYYSDPIGSSVFIRNDYLERLKQEHTIKFFVFTERYTPQTGYAEETSIHFEIKDGKILNEIKN